MHSEPDRYAVIGHPISHSRSPALHAAFARQTGESLVYEAIDAAPRQFHQAVRSFIAAGGRGLNVTLPFKGDAFALVDETTQRANEAQSINTISVESDTRLIGDNTDGAGLMRDLTVNHAITLAKRGVLLLGAGGAARGVLGPLLEAAPALLHIANRTAARARALAKRWQSRVPVKGSGYSELAGQSFDLIINATSASLGGQLPPLPDGLIAPGGACYDLAYADKPTVFLEWGRARGAAQAVDGWGMLIEQAAESFYIWRGVRPDTRSALAQHRHRSPDEAQRNPGK